MNPEQLDDEIADLSALVAEREDLVELVEERNRLKREIAELESEIAGIMDGTVEVDAFVFRAGLNPQLKCIRFANGEEGYVRHNINRPVKVGWHIQVRKAVGEGLDRWYVAGRYNQYNGRRLG